MKCTVKNTYSGMCEFELKNFQKLTRILFSERKAPRNGERITERRQEGSLRNKSKQNEVYE